MAETLEFGTEKQWISSLFRRFGPKNIQFQNNKNTMTAFIIDKAHSKKIVIARFDKHKQCGKVFDRRANIRKPKRAIVKTVRPAIAPKTPLNY